MKNRAKRKWRLGILLLFASSISVGYGFGFIYSRETNGSPTVEARRADAGIDATETFNAERALSDAEVGFQMHSEHALLINLSTNEILFEHLAHDRAYPASLTKIMTVLLGVQLIESETMIIRADFDQLLLQDAVIVGFGYGEERTTSEVLHGAMLASGADATSTIAYHVAGSYEGFVTLMNEKAAELGMRNTHFTNTTGLHHDGHYTTAYDMAKLLEYALKQPEFYDIFTSKTYPFVTIWGEQQLIQSTLFSNLFGREIYGGEMIGGRTGFTFPAGRCLASLATNTEEYFLLITMGAKTYEFDQMLHLDDAILIYGYFFEKMANNR